MSDLRGREQGVALIAVVMVLVALAVIATPFALSMRNHDRGAALLAHQGRAAQNARSALALAEEIAARGDPQRDPTPSWDGLEEFEASLDLESSFGVANSDPRGSIWSAEIEDEQGKLDLNQCSPFALGSLLGGAFLARELTADTDGEVRVSSTEGFADQGVLWIGGELILYRDRSASAFTGLVRGEDLPALQSRPRATHPAGAPVLDYRAVSLALLPYKARTDGAFVGRASVRALKDVARLGEVSFLTEEIERLEPDLTVHAGSAAPGRFLGAGRAIFDFGPDDPEPEVFVAGGRNLGPGSVVRIRSGGTTEYNLVVAAQEVGFDRVRIVLQEPVSRTRPADATTIDALARAPVNVNTCSRTLLVALLEGVRFAGSDERVDRIEAERVADLLLAARPLEGEAEFAEVLRALREGGGISEVDQQALLVNAMHAGDASLAFGTAPFVYRNLGRVSIRAAVSENLRAGREAARLFAREVVEARPTGPQLTVFEGQLEFAEAMRLSRTGKFWTTFPIAVNGFDRFNEPPLPLVPYWRYQRYPVEATEEPQFARMAPARVHGQRDATAAPGDRTIHFDEFRPPQDRFQADHPDGWRTGKLGVVSLPVEGGLVDLLDERGYVEPFEFELWWTPAEGSLGGESWIFDTGESEISNRVFAFVNGGVLYFRVADATVPDDPASGGAEVPAQMAEIRVDFAEEGLPLEEETPYHLKFYARGTKPTDMALFVDGVPRGRRAFQTRLDQGLGSYSPPTGPLAVAAPQGASITIQVEDARLFPQTGVLRIGNELIEYTGRSDKAFFVQSGGQNGAFFGGRGKRDSAGTAHLPSEAVELYGYAAVLQSKNIPKGDQPLGSALGAPGVAMVDPAWNGFKPINLAITGVPDAPPSIQIGSGIDEAAQEIPVVGVGKPTANGVVGGSLQADVFQKDGGFALLVSAARPPPSNGGNTSLPLPGGQSFEFGYTIPGRNEKGSIIGLGELIRYGGFDGKKLTGVKRAPTSLNGTQWSPSSNLAAGNTAPPEDQSGTASHVHVSRWQIADSGHDRESPIFVLPISVGAGAKVTNLSANFAIPEKLGGSGGGGGGGPGGPGQGGNLSVQTRPEMVQIGVESSAGGATLAGGTEWIRYDTIGDGFFVRDHPERIRRVVQLLARVLPELYTVKSGGDRPTGEELGLALNYEAIEQNQTVKDQLAQDAGLPPSALDGGLLAFRGVLGTRAKAHSVNERALPVFRTLRRGDVYAARPGPRDFVTLLDPVGRTKEEHRVNYAYCDNDVEGWGGSACHVALENGVANTFESNLWSLMSEVDPDDPDAGFNALANANIDSRDATRVLKFPSGELPIRVGEEIVFGGDLNGAPSPGGMTLDEIEFFSPETPAPVLPRNLRYVLSRDDDFKGKLMLRRDALRYNLWTRDNVVIETIDPVGNLPEDGVVLLVDEELIAVSSIHPTSSSEAELTVAEGGRGLLGTPIQHHRAGGSVREMTFLRVSRLERALDDKSAEVIVADASDFPPHGVVQVGSELIGYTHVEGNRLLMPQWQDPSGGQRGMLRGRYGTQPERHEQDELVYVFPYRHEDRWHERADDPALGYLGLYLPARGGFFKEVSWTADGATPLVDLVVQARVGGRGEFTDDPRRSADVFQFESPGGPQQSARNLILRQGDGLELRVFTRYREGAFDVSVLEPDPQGPRGGNNDWKKAPKLKAVGVDWLGEPARLVYEEWR